MATASQFVNKALSYVGTREVPPGSNRTIFGERYGWNGVAWCNIFVSEIAREVSGDYDMIGGKFAYTVYHARRFQQMGRWGTVPRIGACAFFDWRGTATYKSVDAIDHIEIVRGSVTSSGLVPCVGGNTTWGGSDGVWAINRNPARIVGYGYPLFSTPKPPTGSKYPRLVVDGVMGGLTVRRVNEFFGLTGSTVTAETTRRLQKYLNGKGARDWQGKVLVVDGKGFAQNVNGRVPVEGRYRTIWALQHRLGTTRDGYFSKPSGAIKKLQSNLNAGTI